MIAFPKPFRLELPAYVEWIKSQPCIIRGCNGAPDPHHIRYAWNTGAGTKPSDSYAVAVCRQHHDEYHQIGRGPFEDKYGVEMLRLIVESLTLYMFEMQPKPHWNQWS